MYPYRSEFSIIIESKSKVSLYFLNCVVISFHEKKNNNNFQIQRLRNDKFCSIDITRYIRARYNSSTFFYLATSNRLQKTWKNMGSRDKESRRNESAQNVGRFAAEKRHVSPPLYFQTRCNAIQQR